MIELTRLNGSRMVVNSDQILWIECNPDTVVTLAHGEKLFVREQPSEVIERVKAFKHAVVRGPEVATVLRLADRGEDRT